jgi:catechol 2,3-dioxygenase-like lactoylglutathione lyase family enzyme
MPTPFHGGIIVVLVDAFDDELEWIAFGCRSKMGGAMIRTWTIIGVKDVRGSFKWYQMLLGRPEAAPAHDDWGQICDDDGTVLLCLHEWGSHDHPSLVTPDIAPPGNGLLLFFRVDDFDNALQSARGLVSRLDEEPHMNSATGTPEFALRDPDGYRVMVSAIARAAA